MNATLQFLLVILLVGGAALFAILRIVGALRRKRPSCCGEAPDPSGCSDCSRCPGCGG